MSSALIIFVRNPVLGKVKTRLASTLGDEKALEIYRILLRHTSDVTKDLAVDKFVFYDDHIDQNDIWENDIFEKFLQQGSDLGERMTKAFDYLFKKKYSKVIIIGSDCFELSESILSQAFDALSNHDVVIGPAEDGGYYLLGMHQFIPQLFDNKKWSSNSVYADTVSQLKEANKSIYELPLLNDVDKETDIDFNINLPG